MDPDLQRKGGGGGLGGEGVSKKFFLASIWSQNNWGEPRPPRSLPWIYHWTVCNPTTAFPQNDAWGSSTEIPVRVTMSHTAKISYCFWFTMPQGNVLNHCRRATRSGKLQHIGITESLQSFVTCHFTGDMWWFIKTWSFLGHVNSNSLYLQSPNQISK